MSKSLISIFSLSEEENPKIPGYFVESTAPINVEGDTPQAHKYSTAKEAEQNLNKIAELLFNKLDTRINNPENKKDFVEIVFAIHGFNNSRAATKARYQEIYNYIKTDSSQQVQDRANKLMFIGYRWPSETLVGDEPGGVWQKLCAAFTALPLLARAMLIGGIIGIGLSMLPQVRQFMYTNPFFYINAIILLVLMVLFFFVISLILLRALVYFRDNYRASNFGVPDLVEFIRQLDKALVNQVKEKYIHNTSLINKLKEQFTHKVKNALNPELQAVVNEEDLELICNQVVESYCKDKTVSLEEFDESWIFKKTTSSITKQDFEEIVKLATRLISIDVEDELHELREAAIELLENQAKRYWKERNRIKLTFMGHSMGAYVVTNAVRLLSNVFDLSSVGTLGSTKKVPTLTIGRAFCFGRLLLISPDIPINTILSGRANFLRSSLRRFEEAYLFSNEGDLALRLASTVANYISFPASTRESGYRLGNVAIKNNQGSGIINLEQLKQYQKLSQNEVLESLFVDSFDLQQSLKDIQKRYHGFQGNEEEIANLFTYFDCTDYTDHTIKPNSTLQRVLSLKKRSWEPGLIYYIRLTLASALRKINTHGGYFDGQFTQQVMYRLAFLGFGGFLDSLSQNNRQSALDYLSVECDRRKIQVLLSSARYEVDILGCDREQIRREMLKS